MKKNNCCCLIGYYTCNLYNYGKVANYYDLLDSANDSCFNLKKDFQFFKNCPFCGKEIDKLNIVSNIKIDLNKMIDRRLYDNSK